MYMVFMVKIVWRSGRCVLCTAGLYKKKGGRTSIAQYWNTCIIYLPSSYRYVAT